MPENNEFMNAFVESAQNVFETMLGMTPECGEIVRKTNDEVLGDISGVMGTSEGGAEGLMMISAPREVAFKIAEGFLGIAPDDMDDDVKECMRELTNMVCGGAKAKLEGTPYFFMLSIPTVITGKQLKVHHKPDHECFMAEMAVDGVKFAIEVSMKRP